MHIISQAKRESELKLWNSLDYTRADEGPNAHVCTVLWFWSALATAPTETSAEAKEASIINNS